jgi:phosphoketolase
MRSPLSTQVERHVACALQNLLGNSILVGDAIDRAPRHYINRHGEDMPEIRHWQWGPQTTAVKNA